MTQAYDTSMNRWPSVFSPPNSSKQRHEQPTWTKRKKSTLVDLEVVSLLKTLINGNGPKEHGCWAERLSNSLGFHTALVALLSCKHQRKLILTHDNGGLPKNNVFVLRLFFVAVVCLRFLRKQIELPRTCITICNPWKSDFFKVVAAFNVKVGRMSIIASIPQDKMDYKLSGIVIFLLQKQGYTLTHFIEIFSSFSTIKLVSRHQHQTEIISPSSPTCSAYQFVLT